MKIKTKGRGRPRKTPSRFKTASASERQKMYNQSCSNIRWPEYIEPDCKLPQYQPVPGNNTIRIVPPLAEDTAATTIGMPIYVYCFEDGSRKRLVVPPNTIDPSIGNPAHDECLAAYRAGDQIRGKRFKGQRRTLIYVLDLNGDSEVVHLWVAAKTAVESIMGAAKTSGISVDDPQHGRTISFNRSGTGMDTKYEFKSFGPELPLDESLAEQLSHFSDILVVPTLEEMRDWVEEAATPF